MSTKNPGGRPSPAIFEANFIQLEKVSNKSNRYWWQCKWCGEDSTRIQGRDNNLVNHLIDHQRCPNCPAENRQDARVFLAGKSLANPSIAQPAVIAPGITASIASSSTSAQSVTSSTSTVIARKRQRNGTIQGYIDHALSSAQQTTANVKLLRFLIHANIAFRATENPYFRQFLNEIRPSYTAPSRYVISHSVFDSEVARVQIEEIERLKPRKRLTLLMDGWEDRLKRSLYGTIAAEVKQSPVVLALHDMTGNRGNAENLLETSQKALKTMEIGDGKNIIALTTDNPSVMQAFRRKFRNKYFWVLTFACFLHQLNTMIGDICSHPVMRKIISQTTRIVSFFNNSHYWGGQVNNEAKSQNIKRKMKQNCESRWYALILQGLSVQAYRNPLSYVSLRPDAQKKTNGQTPVAPNVIQTILYDTNYWVLLNQLLKTTKFIYDAIGNLESREATLADCMLELIRCARTMSQLERDTDENMEFWLHAKSVFRRRFHAINTEIHSLALFLHPLCRKLAIEQVANGVAFEKHVETALNIAKQWKWSKTKAEHLREDLKIYLLCRAPFAGGQADGLAWWEGLTVSANDRPLKELAIKLFSVVPHAAEVERLFSDMGGTQSVKRCNLSVNTFESLSKLRANYNFHLGQENTAAGKSTRRRHGHMHTRNEPGINSDLVSDLETNFAWVPPLAAESTDVDDNLQGPEGISIDEIDQAFDDLARETAEMQQGVTDVRDVLAGAVYDFTELARVDEGLIPRSVDEEISGVETDPDEEEWDVNSIMTSG